MRAGDRDGSSDFDLNPDFPTPVGRTLKPAGVLVAVEPGPGGPHLILTKRSPLLKHHAGQIAFAGGRQDPGDADATDAALREAEEEIGLPREARSRCWVCCPTTRPSPPTASLPSWPS